MRRNKLALLVRLTFLLGLGLGACDGGSDEPTTATSAPSTEPTEAPPPADAGTPETEPYVSPRPVLASGAAGAPAPATRAWTAQFAAQQLVDGGLVYDNGFSHDVTYAECAATSTPDSSGGYSSFECYLESSQVAPYWIDLAVAEDGEARATFVEYAR